MLCASAAATAGTTVYTWVDAQGVVHYSDQPHAGAKKINVQSAPTYAAPPVAAVGKSNSTTSQQQQPACSFESPTDQQMLMNAWSVSGRVHVPQEARGGHVVLMLDGAVLPGVADAGGSFTISQIDRGAHTLAAQVLDANGQVVCEAPSVTFYVHQPNLNTPTSPSQQTAPGRPRP
ncbi:MAG TPA: DUF4124 domain-containing protein [Steroidobacteraceae bacterium]|nr:DUF4124 domain-containing protein [Steroidobacteraceae bacterium]